MLLAILCLLTALTISGVAIYYSVIGLTAIFAAAAIPIMVMGISLEVAKLVATVWLHRNWKTSPGLIKTYLCIAVVVLMLITSMGIFGFLSKAHLDQSVPSGDVAAKVQMYDDKIKTQQDNIETAKKALQQMDAQVNEMLSRSNNTNGAERAVQIRRNQAKERDRLQKEITDSQNAISKLREEKAPLASQLRKVDAEVGPIKYIAAFFYGSTDVTILEKAVTWVIMIIIFVFDPLAVVLLLASQYSFKEYFHNKKDSKYRELFETVDESKTTSIPEEPINPENHPQSEPPINLDEVKEKLNKFNEALAQSQKIETPTFLKMDTSIKGFDVPRVETTQETKGIVPINLEVDVAKIQDADIPFDNLEAWNKMIEAAEKEVANSPVSIEEQKILDNIPIVEQNKLLELPHPSTAEKGQLYRVVSGGTSTYYEFDGEKWEETTVDESHHDSQSYVQNEEQKDSNLWQETIASISQTDYQEKAKEANLRELVRLLDSGEIKIEDLTEEETKALEEYLKKEKDDRQNNTDKSA